MDVMNSDNFEACGWEGYLLSPGDLSAGDPHRIGVRHGAIVSCPDPDCQWEEVFAGHVRIGKLRNAAIQHIAKDHHDA